MLMTLQEVSTGMRGDFARSGDPNRKRVLRQNEFNNFGWVGFCTDGKLWIFRSKASTWYYQHTEHKNKNKATGFMHITS